MSDISIVNKNQKTLNFIEKAKKIHGDKYDYSKVNCVNYKTNLVIVCKIHGEFEQNSGSHLRGSGCRHCSIEFQKLTIDKFIERAIKVHGNKYDYSKVKYANSHTKIIIICKTHGSFEQLPSNHLKNKGCKKCYLSKSKNIDKFIEKANKVHNNKYDYSKVNFVDKNKIIIICPVHGEFLQYNRNHLRGYGCIKCAGKLLMTTNEFIERANKTHNYKYDYSKTKYVNAKTKVAIICPIHDEFLQTASNHLKYGCKSCGFNLIASKTKGNINKFIEKAHKLYKNKFDYSESVYVDSNTKIKIKCFKCGEVFEQEPKRHLGKSAIKRIENGCVKCNKIRKPSKRMSTEEFVKRAELIHGDKYDYSQSVYVRYTNKIKIKCIKCNECFEQKPEYHLKGHGCIQCVNYEKSIKYRKTTEEFVEKAKKAHGSKYDYSKVNYINNVEKVIIICNKHGEFKQNPHHHSDGAICPKCSLENRSGSGCHFWNPDRIYIKEMKIISRKCRNLINRFVVRFGFVKNSKTHDLLGYTRKDLYNHLKSFKNYKIEDHIDHIFPIKAFVEHNIKDLKVINALDNLQPINKNKNLQKSAKYYKNKFYQYLENKYGKLFVENIKQ